MPQSYSNIDVREWQDRSYERIAGAFEWNLPPAFNLATEICEDNVGRDTAALTFDRADGTVDEYSFEHLDAQSSRLANWLELQGVEPGDRVGIALSQSPRTIVSHLAVYKLGAIAVPTSVLMGKDSVTYRIEKADISNLITSAEMAQRLDDVFESVTNLVTTEPSGKGQLFDDVIAEQSEEFESVETSPGTPAMITFTSGTTGHPKGVVHAHEVLAPAHLCFDIMNEFPNQAVVFTPADWAWVAGTIDTAFPAWRDGHTVVGYESRGFDPERVFEVLERHSVTHTLLTPTMIHMIMDALEDPAETYDLALEVIVTGGEPTTEKMFEWIDENLPNVVLNEHYGQSEADLLVTNGSAVTGRKPTSMGRPVPGHEVAVLDDDAEPLPANEIGRIAIRSPDPAIMVEYWDEPDKTKSAFEDDWLITGDTGYVDDDGFLWFAGRGDDLIISSGYRVSPVEVERKLEEHEQVGTAVVVGTPDPDRGEVVTAVVQPETDLTEDEQATLREALSTAVREDLAKYKYPRRYEFVDSLPMTSTDKIARQEVKDWVSQD